MLLSRSSRRSLMMEPRLTFAGMRNMGRSLALRLSTFTEEECLLDLRRCTKQLLVVTFHRAAYLHSLLSIVLLLSILLRPRLRMHMQVWSGFTSMWQILVWTQSVLLSWAIAVVVVLRQVWRTWRKRKAAQVSRNRS